MLPVPTHRSHARVEVQLREQLLYEGHDTAAAQRVIDGYVKGSPKTRHWETSVSPSGVITHALYDDDEERDELFQ